MRFRCRSLLPTIPVASKRRRVSGPLDVFRIAFAVILFSNGHAKEKEHKREESSHSYYHEDDGYEPPRVSC